MKPTEANIGRLVDAFYARVRVDSLLGPIFASKIADDDWPIHLAKLKRFWSSVMLGTGDYKGSPLTAHRGIPNLGPSHFNQWLMLFEQAANDVLEATMVQAFIDTASRIGDSLQISEVMLFRRSSA